MSYSTPTPPNVTLRIGADWVETAETDTIRLPYDGSSLATASRGTLDLLGRAIASARLMQQELFGPLVAVNSYENHSDAVEAVNSTPYGLQAGLFTQHLQRAFATARKLHVGCVLINDVPTFRSDPMPYGGVKRSDLGREGPKYALEAMTEPNLIVWRV